MGLRCPTAPSKQLGGRATLQANSIRLLDQAVTGMIELETGTHAVRTRSRVYACGFADARFKRTRLPHPYVLKPIYPQY